jgi:hypothetical protein
MTAAEVANTRNFAQNLSEIGAPRSRYYIFMILCIKFTQKSCCHFLLSARCASEKI